MSGAFALDHNFPQPIVDPLVEWIPEVQLVPIHRIDATLIDLPDWKLLVALHRHIPRWDGLVSMDDDFYRKPRELVTLQQTKLSVIVVAGVGHDPLRALGLLLHKLPVLAGQATRRRGQLWRLTSGPVAALRVNDEIERVAKRSGRSRKELIDEHKLTAEQLRRAPLSELPE